MHFVAVTPHTIPHPMMTQIVSFLATRRDRFLQGLSVIVFYLILSSGTLFIFGPLTFFGLYHCCHYIWPLVVVYLTWAYFVDQEAFNCGGRRVEFVRNNVFFRYMRDYYPVSLVKTSELDSTRNYIFGYHPHGMIPEGLVVGFASEALQFSKTFPGIVPYIGAHGCKLFSDHSIMYHLLYGKVEVDSSILIGSFQVGILSYKPFPWKQYIQAMYFLFLKAGKFNKQAWTECYVINYLQS